MQRGFSIVSAIFLLVVLAFLGVAMVTFSTSQQQSAALDVVGARAYQAARTGIEWGAYQVLIGGGACAPLTPLPALAGTLSGFAVVVSCTSALVPDANAVAGTVTVYELISTATQGAVGTSDYVERRITVTIGQ